MINQRVIGDVYTVIREMAGTTTIIHGKNSLRSQGPSLPPYPWVGLRSILMGGIPETVTMTGGNAGSPREKTGDEKMTWFCQYGIPGNDLPCLNEVLPIVGENTMSWFRERRVL